MLQKNLDDKENPESNKNSTGYFFAPTGSLARKNHGRYMTDPLAGGGIFLTRGGNMRKAVVGLIALLLFAPLAQAYTTEQIVDAIYKAEGGARAKKPFGILSVKCEGYDSCRKVCVNTVKNNMRRFEEYGHKTYPDFLSFLASRYAPIGAGNDPSNLNVNWLKNVRYFLGVTYA